MKTLFVYIVALGVASSSAFAEEPHDKVSSEISEGASSDREPASPSKPQRPPQRVLTEKDQRLLAYGPISKGRYIGGGITGSIVGFGIGHAIQGSGRYRDRGWIFTAGEGGSIAVMLAGVVNCMGSRRDADGTIRSGCDTGGVLFTTGALAFVGFRIWEIVDLWVAPPGVNRRYEQLMRMNERRVTFSIVPTLVAQKTPGLSLGVSF